jgi:hypothetical protein
MRTFHAVMLIGAIAVLGGCSSMSEKECLATDWRTVGYEDGVAGRSGDRIGRYREQCSEHGVAPSLSEYQAGREQGLREFCKPANGFRVGARTLFDVGQACAVIIQVALIRSQIVLQHRNARTQLTAPLRHMLAVYHQLRAPLGRG